MTLCLSSMAFSQTIGVFYDTTNEQMKFAAGDIKTALEARSFVVEMLPLSALTANYDNEKVVVALATNTAVTNILVAQGGTIPAGLGPQAYGLRTTTSSKTSYWVLGGDGNGAMYGCFQIAENITFNGFGQSYTMQESPSIMNRGIKLNLPLDRIANTYFNASISAGARNAIPNVWDITFWKSWFDTMARNRYNLVSVWSNHHFTSMIKMPEYPDVAIKDVTGFQDINNIDNKAPKLIKTMTIDEKVVFWKEVMAYAKSRGFSFYLLNWNLFLDNAENKYGLNRTLTNPATITYLRKCMYQLFDTYPDLDGFGVTQGEAMGDGTEEEKSIFLGKTYGEGMADYAKDFPARKLNFIHRWWLADFTSIKTNFKSLIDLPNVTFDMSYKYSFAHMYSLTKPDFFKSGDVNALVASGLKLWFTVRNDDFYYHNWGSPAYAREYLKNIPGQGSWFKGFYMGSDGFNPTRTFFSKNSITQGTLEVQRMWYLNMIWGRLSYNPNLSDEVFKMQIKNKLGISSDNLFEAWQKVSSALPKVGEMIFNDFKNDQAWYPENCSTSDSDVPNGFITIDKIATVEARPRDTSNQCGIYNTANNACSGKVSSLVIADQIETEANAALVLTNALNAPNNSELGVTLTSVRAMSYLANYYAFKIRAATFKLQNKALDARNALGTAYCWWIKYTNTMDDNYFGMSMQRNFSFTTWHHFDALVLKEYTDMGGVGIPNCESTCTVTTKAVGCNGSTVEVIGSNNCGGTITLTARPAQDCAFVNFTDGITTWTTNPLVINVTTNKEYTANFTASVAPIAAFSADATNVSVGGTVNFSDISTNSPTSWQWSFPGGNLVSSTLKNPSVVYSNEGEYDVTLTAANAVGSNSITKAKHIVVSKAVSNVTPISAWVSGLNNPKVSGSNRLLVVMVMGESSGDFAANTVTYGNQTMTKQTERIYFVNSSRSYAAIFTLNEAGVSAATSGNIVVNWNVVPTSGSSVYSTIVANVDQTTPVSIASNNALTGTTVAIPSALAAASGDMILMCGATERNNIQSLDNNFIKSFESDSNWGDGVGGYKIGTGVVETPSFTQSASGRMVICAMVIKKISESLSTISNYERWRKAVKIYPNPTSGIVNIDFPDGQVSNEVRVLNALGQVVYSQRTGSSRTQIDTKALNVKGFIIVQVIDGKNVDNHKIIVE
jgi:PKD repeat protein